MIPQDADPSEAAFIRQLYGLDQPLHIQYWVFLGNAVRGDFGRSYRWHDPALKVVLDRVPATLQLAVSAALVSILIALPIGVMSAVRPGGWFDTFGKVFALMGQSMPTFWVGILAILIFSVQLRWFPTSGRGGLQNLVLPAFTLGWASTAALTRLTRSAMLDVMDSDFIKMARIKGVPERWVIWKHALKNAAIPVVTILGVQWAQFLGGSVIVETIFAWPGVGRTIVEALNNRDYAVVQAGTFMISILFVTANLIVDLLYGVIDPRVRYD
ncbi:MAG: ABC transporter permease [Chloroflexi bacterium]|nr:ABC transporter permease [Chloroflexota bacterium]